MRPLYGYHLTGNHLTTYLKLRADVQNLPPDGNYLKFNDPIVQEYIAFVKSLPAIWHLELRKKRGIHLATHTFLTNAVKFATRHCEEVFRADVNNTYLWIADFEVIYDNNEDGLSRFDRAMADWYPSDFGAVCVQGTLPDVVYAVYPLTRETMLDMVLACFEPCLPAADRDTADINHTTSFWDFRHEKEKL